MALSEALPEIRSKIDKFGDDLDNEEITKDVLIRPMIHALGYDSSDPTQVKAEHAVSLPRGGRGRADYVIFHNGEPAIVMECKALGVQLDQRVQNQMQQYARALGAFAGIVTDGETYICYADSGDLKASDLQFVRQANLSQYADGDETVLAMFSRSELSRDSLKSEAQSVVSDLRQEEDFLEVLEAIGATAEVVRLGQIEDADQREAEVEKALTELQRMTREAVRRIANGEVEKRQVVTTHEELDGFWLCKGVLHGLVDPDRIVFRDAKSYFSVLIDDNNRKPVCRFHFNGRQMFLGTFDEEKNETRHPIDGVNDIIEHANKLRRTARRYAES